MKIELAALIIVVSSLLTSASLLTISWVIISDADCKKNTRTYMKTDLGVKENGPR